MKLGLIKGGQLGKMMLEAALHTGMHTVVMDNDPQCPCRPLCKEFVLGDSMNFDDVYAFGKKADVLTFEYEHINIQALRKLEAEGLKIFPKPEILEIVQDKGRQKEFYRDNRIPTAEFRLVEDREGLKACADLFPAVQKSRTAGYDGKGIYKIDSAKDISGAFDVPSVLERRVDFAKEISVLVARDQKGDTVVYPTVEMVFHLTKNLVEFLACPANITEEVDQKAKDIAVDLAKRLAMVGILAVEMFVTKNGEVLVNEIAPRVHNSGHHTIEANTTSQFAQHLRCVTGSSVELSKTVFPAAMVNILGGPGFEGRARYEGIDEALALGNVYVHLYGKAITKPFRKMGHATITDPDVNEALAKARRVKDLIKVKA